MDFNFLKQTVNEIKVSEDIHKRLMETCEEKVKKPSLSRGTLYRMVAAVVAVAVLVTGISIWRPWQKTSIYATNLMEGITPNKVEPTNLNAAWVQAMADFSIELFQKGQTENKNSLISPLSVYLALAMTANGAGGETLEAFRQVLADGSSMDQVNVYLYSLISRLCQGEQETLEIHNSVWFDKKNAGEVYPAFLQKNADYYGAEAFQVDFGNTKDAIEKVNQWTSQATDGNFEEILKEGDLNALTALLLVNTVMFDADWKAQYEPEDMKKSPFQNADGQWVKATMLKGQKTYIADENATGFISAYEDEHYSFVALLPREGMSLQEYIAGLTGEDFLDIIDLESREICLSYLPKFQYEYTVDLKDALKNMGLETAFGGMADFSNMAERGKQGDLYISKVTHDTFIELNQDGTRAGAVTQVHIPTRGLHSYAGNYVFLNRPFLYAIIDNETKLPIFLGTVNELEGEETQDPGYKTSLVEHNGITYRDTYNIDSYVSIVKGSETASRLLIDVERETDNPLTQGVSFIETGAYKGNETLEQVTFQSVGMDDLKIGKEAFANCPNLTRVIFNGYTPYFVSIEEGAFDGSEQVVFYMPESYMNKDMEAYVYAIAHGIPVEVYEETAD